MAMKCLIIVPSLIRAGAETQAVDLANGLSKLGHEIHMCTFERQLDQRHRLVDAVTFHHFQRLRKYDFLLVKSISDLIDIEKFDVVQGVLQFATLIAWLASIRSVSKPPVIAAIHNTRNRGIKLELQERIIYRRVLRRLPAVVFVCNFQRSFWESKYPELQALARVVHNGVESSRFRRNDYLAASQKLRSDLGIPKKAFVFGCIAAFRPEKGHKLLIEAFSRLAGDTFLLLAGDGSERRKVEIDVRKRGLADRVRFLGSVAEIKPVIVACDATVLASTAVETFSMAMLESMALEVPVIAPRIGGLEEAIVNNKTGILYPIGDTAALAAGLRMVTAFPTAAREMGAAASTKVKKAFSFEKMVEKNERVLAEMVCLHSRPAK